MRKAQISTKIVLACFLILLLNNTILMATKEMTVVNSKNYLSTTNQFGTIPADFGLESTAEIELFLDKLNGSQRS